VRHHGDPLDKLHRASIDAIRASGHEWALVSPNSVMETSLLSQARAIQGFNAMFAAPAAGGSAWSRWTTWRARRPWC
jgi:hypothetical protein